MSYKEFSSPEYERNSVLCIFLHRISLTKKNISFICVHENCVFLDILAIERAYWAVIVGIKQKNVSG